jgi:dihydroxyacetone kinase-like protein
MKKLNGAPPADIGALFKTVGMTLLSSVGGAAGPLYGGFFLELGKQTAGKQELDANALVSILEAGLADIQRRGKAELGDKTMVDALAPALVAMRAAGNDIAVTTRTAATAARDAAEKTTPMLARKGRASYLGERSIGHQDPGATSSALLLESLATVSSGE